MTDYNCGQCKCGAKLTAPTRINPTLICLNPDCDFFDKRVDVGWRVEGRHRNGGQLSHIGTERWSSEYGFKKANWLCANELTRDMISLGNGVGHLNLAMIRLWRLWPAGVEPQNPYILEPKQEAKIEQRRLFS